MTSANGVDLSRTKRVVFIGVGGASCSGKTTLAKALQSVLSGSVIIHQDDFAPPEQLIPLHPVHNIKDWDDPEGAIDWPRLSAFLRQVRADGRLPTDHKTHGGWSDKPENPISRETFDKWRAIFADMRETMHKEGTDVSWGLVDGFLLYWHPDVIRELDIRLFLRVPYNILKARREKRFGYHTQDIILPEGSFWVDPPGYWDDIVWPAYLKAHRNIFENEDVNHGEAIAVEGSTEYEGGPRAEEKLTNGYSPTTATVGVSSAPSKSDLKCGQPVARLLVMPSSEISLQELFESTCRVILSFHREKGDLSVEVTNT